MQRNKIHRSFLAIGAIAVLWSAPVRSDSAPRAELHPLVVIGIPIDKVTTVHPTPEYPRTALALGVDGKVQIEVKVHNGRITEAKVLSGMPMLASSAKAWIVGNWKFKPEISVVFTIPINYTRRA